MRDNGRIARDRSLTSVTVRREREALPYPARFGVSRAYLARSPRLTSTAWLASVAATSATSTAPAAPAAPQLPSRISSGGSAISVVVATGGRGGALNVAKPGVHRRTGPTARCGPPVCRPRTDLTSAERLEKGPLPTIYVRFYCWRSGFGGVTP